MTDNIVDSTRMQLDLIMKKFRKLKNEKMALAADNTDLKVECRKLRDRHSKSESHRHTLIKLCSESTQKNKTTIQSLERENKHLRDIVEEQSQQIDESSKKINRLTKEVERLKKEKNEESKLKAEIERLKAECKETQKLKDELEALKKQQKSKPKVISNTLIKPQFIKTEKGLVGNITNFSHPSFVCEIKSPKIKKKIKSLSQLRWANLDIHVNGSFLKGGDSDSSGKSTKDKKRRLYSSNDDVTVDLTNEE